MRSGRIFLLSPANASGKRARLLTRPHAASEFASRLRGPSGAELGDVFTFMSSLYFRGKLEYARVFARAPRGLAGIHVITPCDGLRTPETRVGVGDLDRYAQVPVTPDDERYRAPFLRDVNALARDAPDVEVVLLGSIASEKYVELLTSVFGPRLLFPIDFVGRGDMSRGGLLLRSARDRRELPYAALLGAKRRGSRPARLPPIGTARR